MSIDTTFDYKIELWSREDAKEALKETVAGQRKADPALIAVFRKVWEKGRWHPLVGAPVAFDQNGKLQNGTHRATFISQLPAGETAPVLVAREMPEWAVEHYDTGKNRTLGNFLKYAFPDKADSLCANAASIASYCMTYSGPGSFPRPDSKQRPDLVVEWAIANGDRLFSAAETARKIVDSERDIPNGKVMTVRTLGFVLFYLPESADFFAGLAARRFQPEDPRQTMTTYYHRNPFPKGAMSRQVTTERLASLLACWDAANGGAKWKPWDSDLKSFRHPQTNHMHKEN